MNQSNLKEEKHLKKTDDESTFSDSLYLSGIGDSQIYGDYEEELEEVEEKLSFPKVLWHLLNSRYGGGGGIRTHGRVAPSPVFKTGTFNRSVTPPSWIFALFYCDEGW